MSSFYESSVPQSEEHQSRPAKLPISLLILTLVLVPFLIAYNLVTGKNELQVIGLVLAIVSGLIIIARPVTGLFLFVGLVFTRPEENISALAGMRLPLIVSVVTLLATIFHKLLNREPLARSPMNGMIFGFGIAVVISAIPSGIASVAAQDIGRSVILVVLILNLIKDSKKITIFCSYLIIFTAYLAIYSIYLFSTGQALYYQGVFRSQATGIFGDPNDLAGTIVAGLGLNLYRIFSRSVFSRILSLVLSGIFIFAIFQTSSRGGLLALILVLGFFIYTSVKKKLIAVALACVMIIGVLVFSGGRMTNFDSSEASANSRFWFWTIGIEALQQSPIFGIGYAGFPEINGGMTAHNSFVLCATETGLIGYSFWMGCIYLCFCGLKNRISLNSDPEKIPKNGLSRLFVEFGSDEINYRGAMLALIGFLASGFWISRSYITVLYIYLSLPVVYKIVTSSQKNFKFIDCVKILLISLASIVIIYVYALRNR